MVLLLSHARQNSKSLTYLLVRFKGSISQRMSSLITHPLFDYKVSYRRALELQARLLAKTLTREIADYVPLMTR